MIVFIVYNIIIMLYRGNSHQHNHCEGEMAKKAFFLQKIAIIVNIAYNISLAITLFFASPRDYAISRDDLY